MQRASNLPSPDAQAEITAQVDSFLKTGAAPRRCMEACASSSVVRRPVGQPRSIRSAVTVGRLALAVLSLLVSGLVLPVRGELSAQLDRGSSAVEGSAAVRAVSWVPARPMQGQLFQLRVEPSEGVRLTAANGSVFGEALHFEQADDGALTAVAAVPVDAGRDIALELDVRAGGGVQEAIRTTIPVFAASFAHEELTVAPRFGSPPSAEDRERRARDAARARAVSEEAHRTERLWTSETVIPRVDRVTSEFGNGRVFNGQVSSRHMGLDLDGETGDTVYAAARGRVELVDEFLLAGNIVYLNHGAGLISGYFHLSEQLVEEGQMVEPGTPIGRVGATGRVTGPHLHWVVRYGYISVDPRSLAAVVGPQEM